jgi:2-oxoglutarate dehydrogenase E1 component
MPEGFTLHPKLERQFVRRRERFDRGEIDWALAESLAFGTLALGGTPVRLSGEDSGRGTFSQRHAVLYDHRSAEPWVPLAHLAPDQAPFHVVDSLLSEFAVMGFEYGYSVTHPQALVSWEAQFGDFCNGAQVVIDQFLASARAKWGQTSGLVLLLPHGFEGQGPEHSSARLERFLQLAADDNLRIVYPSTPAQYFHLLRAQALHPQRRPLVVMTPKSLLRHRACVSSPQQLSDGAFSPVLADPRSPAPSDVRRVVACTGKVWFDLDERREAAEVKDAALWRLEQLYPFPEAAVRELLAAHPAAEEIVWVQEEPSNMGAWSFVSEALRELLGADRSLRYVGRPRAASPATGSYRRHSLEQERLVDAALRPAPLETDDSVPVIAPR